MGRLPRKSELEKRRDLERMTGEVKKQGKRRIVWSLPDSHPQVIAHKERRARLNQKRFGKGGRWDRLADAMGNVPVLGETALAPMRGFLKGSVKAFEATKDKDNIDTEAVKEVAKNVFDVAKDMKK